MTWLDSIQALEEHHRDSMLEAVSSSFFHAPIPDELAFLKGRWVDMGFQNRKDISRAFAGTGVIVPGTSWRLRFVYPWAVVEPVDGTEQMTLPINWKQGVFVLGEQGTPTWVGKQVQPDKTAGYNLQGYQDVGDGFAPPDSTM